MESKCEKVSHLRVENTLTPLLGTHSLGSSFKREKCFTHKVKTQSGQVISEHIQPYDLLC